MGLGRILAIDYGSKNIGLACSDELRITVRPLPSVRFSSRRDLIARLRAIVSANDVQEVVIGLPLNMDGSSGVPAQRAERFRQALCKEFGFPMKCVDERLSTLEAADLWKELTPRQRRKYHTLDSLAAVLILQRHLKEN